MEIQKTRIISPDILFFFFQHLLSFILINSNPLQYSCLENSMDGGAWWATVHRVTKSWTQLSDFTSLHSYKYLSTTCDTVNILTPYTKKQNIKYNWKNIYIIYTFTYKKKRRYWYLLFTWYSMTMFLNVCFCLVPKSFSNYNFRKMLFTELISQRIL